MVQVSFMLPSAATVLRTNSGPYYITQSRLCESHQRRSDCPDTWLAAAAWRTNCSRDQDARRQVCCGSSVFAGCGVTLWNTGSTDSSSVSVHGAETDHGSPHWVLFVFESFTPLNNWTGRGTKAANILLHHHQQRQYQTVVPNCGLRTKFGSLCNYKAIQNHSWPAGIQQYSTINPRVHCWYIRTGC